MSDILTPGQLDTIAICLDHGRRPHIDDCRKLLEMSRAYVAQDAVADYVDEMAASAPGDTLTKEDLAAVELDLNCGIRPKQLDVHRLIATCRYHMQRADSLDYQYRVVCKGVGIEPVSCELVAEHARDARAPRIAACDIDVGTIIDSDNTEPLMPFGECGQCPEWSEVRKEGSNEGVCCSFASPHNGNGRKRGDKPCFWPLAKTEKE